MNYTLLRTLPKELVVNEKMTSNEQDALLSDYVKFDLGGWKLLMGV